MLQKVNFNEYNFFIGFREGRREKEREREIIASHTHTLTGYRASVCALTRIGPTIFWCTG